MWHHRSVTEFGIRTGLRNQVLWVRVPPLRPILYITHTAEWSSMEAHKVHTLEIAGSNPASATKIFTSKFETLDNAVEDLSIIGNKPLEQ